MHFVEKNEKFKELAIYCDGCTTIIRYHNKVEFAMLTHLKKFSNFVEKIKKTYLLPGRTMMPVDSVHSTIESFVRRRIIWTPSESPTTIRNARTSPSN